MPEVDIPGISKKVLISKLAFLATTNPLCSCV